jgi:AmmeMemoRadiSam system protein B
VHLLDLRTSADTAGEPDRVVGYGAFVVLGGE